MTLQEQVCTLEQAKRLKELGCKQASGTFYFNGVSFNGMDAFYAKWETDFVWQPDLHFAAYTVAELGEMLAELDGKMPYYSVKDKVWWWDNLPVNSLFTNEAQARAALLIHILEKEKEHDT